MQKFAVALLPVAFLGLSGIAAGWQQTPPPSSALIAGYRKNWTRVNVKPHRVPATLSALCWQPTPQQKAITFPHSDNSDKFVTVFVNETGRQAMLQAKKPLFPPGSVIAKEKLARPDSPAPELLTVMRKRETGYAPAAGDWEYLVFDGTGEHLAAQGHLPTCQSCHAQWQKTGDFVSRVYFTDAMRRKLQ